MLPTSNHELSYDVGGDGTCPFEKWFMSLDAAAAAKVSVALTRLEQGNLSSVKSVGEGVAESRIDWGPGYRIYLGQENQTLIILLIGGIKKRQQRDVEQAKLPWTDYKRRRAAAR